MATTALIVEVLVVGALGLCWMASFALLIFATPQVSQLERIAISIGQVAGLLVVPLLAFTYALGWILNFCAERALKPYFQRHIRDKYFVDTYEKYRLPAIQYGSPALVHDLQIDRHLIRIARGGVLNFDLLAVSLFARGLLGRKLYWALSGVVLSLAAISFFQWLTRYKFHYQRLANIKVVLESPPNRAFEPTAPVST